MADVSGQLLQEWKNAPNKESQSTSRVTSASWCLKSSSSRFLGKTTILPRPIPVLFAEDGARDLKFAEFLGRLRTPISAIAPRTRRENRMSIDTLVGMLQACYRDSGKLMQAAQLENEVVNLVVAGYETTASLSSWVWYLLATHTRIVKLNGLHSRGDLFARG
jgi:Cytochrome P450